jgi:hypothetical protein
MSKQVKTVTKITTVVTEEVVESKKTGAGAGAKKKNYVPPVAGWKKVLSLSVL